MKKRKIIFHSPLKYLIIFIIGLIITSISLFVKGFNLLSFVDGFFISGASLIFIGLLSCLFFYGAFDTFSFSFSYVKNSYSKNKDERVNDFYKYKQNKNSKRENMNIPYTPYLINGLLFLIIAIVFYIIFKASV